MDVGDWLRGLGLGGHRGEEVRQRSAEPVQLPDDQAVASFDESQRLGEAGTIAAAAGGPILKKVALVDPGGEKRVALQVQNLAVTVRGHAHVTDQHVRKTSSNEFPHSHPFRQGLSLTFLSPRRAICGDAAGMLGITCFPTSSPIGRPDPSMRFSAEFRGLHLTAFSIRPLMRIWRPFR